MASKPDGSDSEVVKSVSYLGSGPLEETDSVCAEGSLEENKPRDDECAKKVTVQVKEAGLTQFQKDAPNRPLYPMLKLPRGHALVMVNQSFNEQTYSLRKGAENDFQRLVSLFSGLGYAVHHYWNKTASEMRNITRRFANEHVGTDESCVVAVSTHVTGPRRDDKCKRPSFVGSDCKEFAIEDLISMLNNENCKTLRNKPKLFFFQADDDTEQTDGNSVSLDLILPPKKPEKLASFTDMWIYTSCIPVEDSGSHFITAITKIFAEHACSLPLSQLYVKVDELMDTWMKQPPGLSYRSFTKDLYFNPRKHEKK